MSFSFLQIVFAEHRYMNTHGNTDKNQKRDKPTAQICKVKS